jgi:hypothetical protein
VSKKQKQINKQKMNKQINKEIRHNGNKEKHTETEQVNNTNAEHVREDRRRVREPSGGVRRCEC